MQRFSRTRLFIGDAAFSRLSAGHVAVIGIGAVGGYVVEGLARAGIGRLTLVDFDTIQVSNINRQLLALDSTIGQEKAVAAKQRVIQINPACRVEAFPLFADSDSITPVLAEQPDILIDAIDSLNPKVQILTRSVKHGIKTMSSMGAALRSDPALIKTGDISETRNCPLARRLRQRLRANGIENNIFTVYSTETVQFDYPVSEPERSDQPFSDRGRVRRTLGSLPTLTGLFGLILANEALRYLIRAKR
ncbi:MAG: tRNA threonylcarbamoyladenosine dehydratase [Proteobacteria bacterium]|nr:MAG: tRNA threonylcarbamoyladenosine dehydratase [Pseudomonadota bacterium]PIE64890.1 MAG: tRNA threonylcarbamoyladenosine dehydratase [Desulfobacterales bacterium]